MSDLYYIGDSVPFSFEIQSGYARIGEQPYFKAEESPQAKLLKINVSIFTDEGQIVQEDPVEVVDNTVTYTLDPAMTKHSGDYAAIFSMTFGNGQEKTYKMYKAVLPLNASRDLPTEDLTPESTEIEIETALGKGMRMARKRGGQVQEAYDSAQAKIHRRLPK